VKRPMLSQRHTNYLDQAPESFASFTAAALPCAFTLY
jgi:hypothetical protein